MRRKASPTTKAVAFFYAATTRGQARPYGGRRVYATHLARAEAEASALGWRADWEGDPDGDEESWGVVLRDVHGRVVASRWGVADASRVRRRVVEAELALEALRGEG